MSISDRPVTVRLSEQQVTHLMGLAIIDDTNLAEQLRQAVAVYIEQRRSAPDFAEQVEAARTRQDKTLESLT